ncbi:hypothetical protein AAC387_Pa11g2286 [Persea americana]
MVVGDSGVERELAGDGATVGVQLQQVGGEEKRRRNRLAHRMKRGKLASDGGAERGTRWRERWSSVMGWPLGFARSQWEGKRRGEKMRGEERRGEEGLFGIIEKVGVFSKTCGCKQKFSK